MSVRLKENDPRWKVWKARGIAKKKKKKDKYIGKYKITLFFKIIIIIMNCEI